MVMRRRRWRWEEGRKPNLLPTCERTGQKTEDGRQGAGGREAGAGSGEGQAWLISLLWEKASKKMAQAPPLISLWREERHISERRAPARSLKRLKLDKGQKKNSGRGGKISLLYKRKKRTLPVGVETVCLLHCPVPAWVGLGLWQVEVGWQAGRLGMPLPAWHGWLYAAGGGGGKASGGMGEGES